jgi:hypothetical protein
MRIHRPYATLVTIACVLCASASACRGFAAEPLREIHAQPSWILSNDDVELAITRLGGHMAPVTFARKSDRPIQPYYVSPWQEERLADLPAAVLVPLRGDFFCMPFGGNAAAVAGQQHPPHGEAATAAWTLAGRRRDEDGTVGLTLTLDTAVRTGQITKEIFLKPGQPVVYSRHRIEGFVGPTPLGHHATLAMPKQEGGLAVSVSPFRLGLTNPTLFSDPTAREYQSLAIGGTFSDLAMVPSLFKEPAHVDCSRFPTRNGFTDLLAVMPDAARLAGQPAWTAAVNAAEGWVWFSIRDPRVLPLTVFWIENGGRHGLPWNGRNSCLGLEDVCGFFADGLAASVRPNLLTAQGVPTAIELSAERPTEIRYAQGAVRVPAGFDRVARVEFGPGRMRLESQAGPSVDVPIRHDFVLGSEPARP